MSRLLSDRQAEELHKSVIAYFASRDLPNVVAVIRAELGIGEDVFDESTTKRYETLLEKKWTGVIRLQKKVLELESRVATLQTELQNVTPTSLLDSRGDSSNWLPSNPARYTLKSHQHEVSCVAVHPVYSTIASGDRGSSIKIWDWELGELERTLKGHTGAITDVDFGGADGRVLLASSSSDLTIKLWDPAIEYKGVRTLSGHDHAVSAVRFIPSGNLLVSASWDATLRVWDVSSGFCVKVIHGHSDRIRDVCPSSNGTALLSTGDDKTVRRWDISKAEAENKLTLTGHENYVTCCVFAPTSSYEYLASLAGLKKPPPASSTAEFMASGSRDKTVKLWDARGTCIKTLVGHENWVQALAFHPSGRYLISVADDKSLRCWDLSQGGKCVKEVSGIHDHFVSCMKWVPVARKGGEEGVVKGRTGESLSDVQIRCVIATGSVDKTIKIFAG